jgi:meso-butanediol dehydrogenase / (S,S)-butanediol dehydrogenase / diacetyl reductase
MTPTTQHLPVDSLPLAVVTGGARGIGLAIGQWFLANGYRVALLDIDEATLATTSADLHNPDKVLCLPCDVSNEAAVNATMAQVAAQFGRIDALVNNAGIAVFKPIGDTSFAEWRSVLSVNLDGAFLCTQACVPYMLKNEPQAGGTRGAVVSIASISGLRASTLRVAYGTSKAAIIALTKQQAIELGNAGIRCNVVAPGPVDTEMSKLVHSVAIRSDYYDTIPLNRYGTVDEIASVTGFLCSAGASYVNGQVLAVDGGFDASGVGLPTLRKNTT